LTVYYWALLVGQVSNLTGQSRSGWKPDLPATHPL